jgi:hypothetical protein
MLMKTLLSISVLCIAVSSFAQINQKTIELRKHYPKTLDYRLKIDPARLTFQNNFFADNNISRSISIISTEYTPKPSTESIKKAFSYYNGLNKTPDYSGFLLTGYSLFTKQNVMSSMPQESIRFFPANAKD